MIKTRIKGQRIDAITRVSGCNAVMLAVTISPEGDVYVTSLLLVAALVSPDGTWRKRGSAFHQSAMHLAYLDSDKTQDDATIAIPN
jgi:hypothetical protein